MSLHKKHSQPIELLFDKDVLELKIDLSKPRVIPIRGKDYKGNELIWHLKITQKRRLVLL